MNASRVDMLRQLDLAAVTNREEVTKNAVIARLKKTGPQSKKQLARWFSGTPEYWLNAVLLDLVAGDALTASRNGLSRRAGTVYDVRDALKKS